MNRLTTCSAMALRVSRRSLELVSRIPQHGKVAERHSVGARRGKFAPEIDAQAALVRHAHDSWQE